MESENFTLSFAHVIPMFLFLHFLGMLELIRPSVIFRNSSWALYVYQPVFKLPRKRTGFEEQEAWIQTSPPPFARDLVSSVINDSVSSSVKRE